MRRSEAAHDAGENVDAAVDPGAIDAGGGAVGKDAGFAIVQCADDDIGPAKVIQSYVGEEIAVDGLSVDFGIDVAGGAGGGGGFEISFITFAEEDRAGEIAGLDVVHIDDQNVADAKEGEVFDHFVAQCACTDDEDAGGGDFLLVPPLDGAQAGEALVGEGDWLG